MEDGGYKKFNFWLDDGWSWLSNENITNPLYWHKIDGNWFYFTLSGLQIVERMRFFLIFLFMKQTPMLPGKGTVCQQNLNGKSLP